MNAIKLMANSNNSANLDRAIILDVISKQIKMKTSLYCIGMKLDYISKKTEYLSDNNTSSYEFSTFNKVSDKSNKVILARVSYFSK